MRRFTRQIRLAEVGEVGQAKLSTAQVALQTSGFAQKVEAAYLRAAGVGIVESGQPTKLDAPSLGIRHDAAREVATGAYAALLAMREALGIR